MNSDLTDSNGAHARPAGASAPTADADADSPPGSRPSSAAASPAEASSDETGSEVDFTAVAHRHRPVTAERVAAEPVEAEAGVQLDEEQVARSAFIDLQHPITFYEGLKLVLMAPVVVMKVLVLCVAVPYAWAVLALLLVGHTPQTPMAPFRQFLVRQWIHQWGRFLLFVAGFFYIPTRGWHNMRAAEESRAILVFNHPSYVDAAVIASFLTPSGVSKAGVADIPFIGTFGVAMQLFFVERKGAGDQSNRHVLQGDAVDAIAERAADRRFPLVAIAPEATTKAKPCLLKFRRGAFVAGQPVCPVLLRYRYKHCNPGWGICNTLFHMYRLMAQFVNHLEIEVLPVYHPSGAQ